MIDSAAADRHAVVDQVTMVTGLWNEATEISGCTRLTHDLGVRVTEDLVDQLLRG